EQRVDAARAEAPDDAFEERPHRRYISSTWSANSLAMAARFTFWVAVSSPSSWSSSLVSIRNVLTCSGGGSSAWRLSTMDCTSATTSGLPDRSRYVVYGMPRRCAHSPTVSSSMPTSAATYGRRSPTTMASLTYGDALSVFSSSLGAMFLPPD